MAVGRRRHRETGANLGLLAEASAPVLRRFWQDQIGAPPSPTLLARIMRVALAWQIQAVGERSETPAIKRQWQAVMRRRAEGASAADAVSGLSAGAAPAGTRLLKSWAGETHEVIVQERTVLWNGNIYTSLSAVARAITGTPRNGPKFFGLREDNA